MLQARPNVGHAALPQLEAQKGEGFFWATQNVNGLHRRAGNKRLVELHGNLLHARCDQTGQRH